ncbi:hypothetical protein K9512_004302 [Vibrio parahaemolyticus]|nr:hypothetical protein [Vibrio parahaemolyticus]
MKCKLCERSEKLQKSHIIPRFLYKFMLKITDNNITQFDSTLNLWQRTNRQLKNELFCFDCEQLLSSNELEFSKIFKDINSSSNKAEYTYIDVEEGLLRDMDSLGFHRNEVIDLINSSPISKNIRILEYFSISYIYRELINNSYNIPSNEIKLLQDYLLGKVNCPIMLHIRLNTSEPSFNMFSTAIVLDCLDDWKHYIFYLPNMQFHIAIRVNGTPENMSKTIVIPANFYEDEIGSIQIIKNVQKDSRKASNLS